jgi:hypothetical protein
MTLTLTYCSHWIETKVAPGNIQAGVCSKLTPKKNQHLRLEKSIEVELKSEVHRKFDLYKIYQLHN